MDDELAREYAENVDGKRERAVIRMVSAAEHAVKGRIQHHPTVWACCIRWRVWRRKRFKDESEDTITKSEMNIFKCDSQAYYIKPK